MNRNLIIRFMKSGVMVALMILVIVACKKKDDTPVSTTTEVITSTALYLGPGWAALKGEVNAKNVLSTVTFQWDTVTTYTNTVSPDTDTTSANTLTTFYYVLKGLKPKTVYHYRVVATNSKGTFNGGDVTFTTKDTTELTVTFNPDLTYDSIYDIQGNKYKTIQIGTQTWTAENLRTTVLNDSSEIDFGLDQTRWNNLSAPGYTFYDSDSTGYGALYNWYTVESGKICPEGWHVPSDDEWTILTDYLGGSEIAGTKLKETGTLHWIAPNTGATNESGFSAIPSGYRSYNGVFNNNGYSAYFWTSTEFSSTGAWYRDIYHTYLSVDRSNSHKRSGLLIRCIKD